ncbi:sulfatase-like hydrolase/transferase [Paenibacillus sp. CC-CFT747]|nr:sulfatase-like hydrolase/transferase [Paenibacillus sp. CC-CFT747]
MRNRNRRPNIVVFFTDQQRWDSMGAYGNPLGLTPHFDRFAGRGTLLEAGITCQPICGPARSAFQTGMYPTRTGCHRNTSPLPADARTLAHEFRDAGYRTGYIGKWHLASANPVPAEQRGGYEYWLAANVPEITSEPYEAVLHDNDNRKIALPGYRPDAYTDAAIRYIDRHQEEPFFLFVSYLEPHQQNRLDDFSPPDGYREPYTSRWTPPDLAALKGSAPQQLGGYWGMVKRLDECFGRLLDALKSLDLLDHTIVLFTSDHGCHFKTRNHLYKQSCHESSVRVPMAFAGPGFDRGGRIAEPVSLIDLPPTLLEAAGLEVPERMQGRSLLPLLRRETAEWPEEVFIQISTTQVGRAVRTKRWKYGVDAPGKHPENDAGSDRYVEEFLYDLQSDPYELTNLIGLESHREVSDALRERLLRRMAEAGEAAPLIDPVPPVRSGQRRVRPEEALM